MILPYISFNGNCEEAFLWYTEVFAGKMQHLAKYGDMPEEFLAGMNEEQKQKVMHAQLMLTENGGISGADSLQTAEQGNVSIQAHLAKEEEARRVFSELSQGGVIAAPLVENPPPDDTGISGCVKDKYGIVWIISAMKDWE